MPFAWAALSASATWMMTGQSPSELQALRRQQSGEGVPLQRLHDDEVAAVVFVDVVDRADVRMIQRGDGPRLALESFAEFAVT